MKNILVLSLLFINACSSTTGSSFLKSVSGKTAYESGEVIGIFSPDGKLFTIIEGSDSIDAQFVSSPSDTKGIYSIIIDSIPMTLAFNYNGENSKIYGTANFTGPSVLISIK